MCGLIVRAGFREPWRDGLLDRLRRRGPDGSGHWQDPDIQFGHTLLSIVGASKQNQPLVTDRHVLIFNGLITNYERLTTTPGTQDTQVLLEAWARHGEAILRDLNGFWAFAVYDRSSGVLTLVRDQFGVKPLYYWDHGDRFCAASTLSALVAAIGHTPELDEVALSDYALYQMSLGSETFFKGVRRVPPGHLVTHDVRAKTTQIRSWEDIFSPVPTNEPLPLERGWMDTTRGLLHSAVEANLVGRRPWTVLASGGIDSTIITRLSSPVHAFHGYFVDPDCDERPFAREAVRGTSTTLIEHQVTDRFDLVARCRAILEDFDDLSIGSVILPLDELLGLVTQQYPVVLTGTGADELFGGYARYQLALHRCGQTAYHPLFQSMNGLRSVAHRFERAHRKGDPSWYVLDQRRAQGRFFEALESCRSPHLTGIEGEQDTMLRFDRKYFLPGLLNIDDLMGGRHGLEARPVFLHQPLVRQIQPLLGSQLMEKGTLKRLLRELGADTLPPRIADRKDKMGFTTPVGTFTRASAQAIREQLSASGFRHLYRLPEGPLAVPNKYSREVFGLLMMDLWLNRYASREAR